MKKIIAMGIFCLAAVICGCTSYRTPPIDRRVTVSPDIMMKAWITDIRMVKNASSHYMLQANIVNNTDDDMRVEYRVVWLDENGVAIQSLLADWKAASLAAREIVGLTAVAPVDTAGDFRLHVRKCRW